MAKKAAKKRDYTKMTPLEVYALVVKGKLKKFPNNYLDKDIIKVIVRHLLLVVYGYTREDVLTKVNHEFFSKNFLGGARKFFNVSDMTMIIYCFPEWDIQYWEFKEAPMRFWQDVNNRKAFVLWIGKKENLDLNTKEGLRKITAQTIYKYAGCKPLSYSGGIFGLLDTVACGKYKKWEITKMLSWPKEDIIDATKWLIEEKLCYTPEQVCNIKVEDFAKNNLDGMLQKGCNHSILEALELAYPGMYFREGIRGIKLKK